MGARTCLRGPLSSPGRAAEPRDRPRRLPSELPQSVGANPSCMRESRTLQEAVARGGATGCGVGVARRRALAPCEQTPVRAAVQERGHQAAAWGGGAWAGGGGVRAGGAQEAAAGL